MSEPDKPERNDAAPGKRAPSKTWSRHFDEIGDEMLRLTAVCDVRLRDPGVVERVLNGDETVCGKKNPHGFRKLRDLLKVMLGSVDKAAGRIGAGETRQIIDTIVERLDQRRALASGKGSATVEKKKK